MKKILCLTAILLMTAVTGFAADRSKAEPDVIVDGSKVLFDDQNAVIVDGVTLVPARGVFEAMGNSVKWDGKKQMVQITTWTGVRNALLYINSDTMTVTQYKTLMDADTKEVKLEVPAQIMNDRTMIPLRAVSEAFDCEVEWNEEDYVINITTIDPPLLEGYEHKPKTPVEEMVTMSLSADAKDVKKGDEFDVYIEIKNIPENTYVSAIVATFEFDKTKVEYIEGSGSFLNDNDEAYFTEDCADNANYETGARIFFLTMDEETARTKDGRVFKATFKKTTDGSATISLNNDFRSIKGYETYPMFTSKQNETQERKYLIFEGRDLNLIKTPLIIE